MSRRAAPAALPPQPELTIFHYPVWAFPHFTMHAASATSGPLLLLGSIDPAYPGMSFVSFEDGVHQARMRQSTFEWPYAFARLSVDSAQFLSRFGANHIHAVPGDRIGELQAACTFPSISFEPLGSPPG
jgi:L-fucose isomerase-like protein